MPNVQLARSELGSERWTLSVGRFPISFAGELHSHHWPRGSRSVKDALKNVLQLSGGIRGRPEHPYVSDVFGTAGRVASDESRGFADDRADRPHVRLRN